jgi:hypothetical protein
MGAVITQVENGVLLWLLASKDWIERRLDAFQGLRPWRMRVEAHKVGENRTMDHGCFEIRKSIVA